MPNQSMLVKKVTHYVKLPVCRRLLQQWRLLHASNKEVVLITEVNSNLLYMLWFSFFPWCKFYFHLFLINSLSYITIPQNRGK